MSSQVIDGTFVDLPAPREVAEVWRGGEASFRLLFANNPHAMYVHDPETLCILEVNEAALAQYGYSREEFLLLRITDIRPSEDVPRLLERLKEDHEGLHFGGHWRHQRKNGEVLDVEITTHSIEFGGRKAFLVVAQDISARLRAEQVLRTAEAKYRTLVEQLPAITYIAEFGSAGRWHYVSPQIESLLGFTPDEWAADPSLWFQQTHPDDRDRILADEARSRETGTPFDSTYRMFARDGHLLWFRDRAAIVRDDAGRSLFLHGVMMDVTEERKTGERFRSIFENAVEGFFQTTPDGGYVSINPALARMYGYSSPEALANSVNDIGRQVYVDPKRREEFKRIMEEQGVVEGFEYQVYRRDGVKIWLSENARAVRGPNGELLYYEGTVEDITELRRSQAEREVTFEIIHGLNVTSNLDELLGLIHQSLKKVVHAENCFVALYDEATRMFRFPFFADQFDAVPPPQTVGRSCTAYVFRTGRGMLIPQNVFDQLVQEGEVELVGTPSPAWLGVPLRTPSATIGVLVLQHYEDDRAYSERDLEFLSSVGGQIAMAIERKRGEAALRESEERLRVFVEQLPAVLWTTDKELRFTSQLGAGLARLGLKPNQVVGMSLFEYFQTNDQGFLPIAAHRRALTGEPVTFHIEWGGGSYACHAEPLRGVKGEPLGTICMALDVTDRKQLEAQLRQAQKMEAVGRLAGGIAHDFNNLLMVIQGYTELLLGSMGETDPLRRNADQIHQAAERAAALTHQLLAFSRKQVLAPKVLNINSVVGEMEKMLRRLIGEDIELVTMMPPDLWQVKADRSQVEQVILNLAVNARDAMPRGGKLTIETTNVELDSNYSHQHAVVAPGHYVMLAVTDTGVGMDRETQAHVFEPFFTTKEKGKGTGLGLATVYGVVKQSGGYVWVYSEPGQGTTFKVYLPRVEETVAPSQRLREATAPRRGSETILLVEDESGVRELACEYLQHTGYTVLAAQSSAEALDIARNHSGEIHLMLTDVVMPGTSGRELADQMAQLRPKMKVLYMSGYTDRAIVHHGILAPDTILLQKPFTLNTLACKLRETLDLQTTEEQSPSR